MRTVTSPIQKGRDDSDLGRHSKMFRPYRGASPFSLNSDLDMWDTKSRFTAQTSAWCGMASVSGTGFLTKVSTSTSGSTSGFRQNDPGLRKWQSLSHLAPEGAPRSFPPSPGAELRAARGESSFRKAGGVQWLQDAHERLDNQLDRLRTRNPQLNNNITTTQLLDMKYKEKEASESSQSETSRQHGDLHEKVLQLEKELLRMRSPLDKGSSDQPTDRTLPVSQEDLNQQERQTVDTELCQLREALRDAELRAKTQEEERNQELQKLQTSTETQRRLLSEIEELNQRRQNHSEVQEQLSDANNKISQACLEKAILSTQVLKQEDEIKELKVKLTEALSDQNHRIQERADLHQRAPDLQLHTAQQQSHNNKQDQQTVLMKGGLQALREANEKLTRELEIIKQEMEQAQSQLWDLKAERITNSKQITDLEAQQSLLIREKEELLSKSHEGGHEELTDMKEHCRQLSESVEVLELEKQKLQDLCLCLEAKVLEKEEKLHLQEETHRRHKDAVRVQSSKELKAVASHWAEKWQKVALTLQSTQKELEELKKNNSRDEKESDSLLRVELDACKQELELERSSQALLRRYEDKGAKSSAQTEDTGTQTVLSQSSLLWEPPSDSHSSQNKAPQKSPEADQDNGGQANVSNSDSLRAQLEVSGRRTNQLQQEEAPAVQRLQRPRQLYPVKDEKPAVEVSPGQTDQQRRMVTEQLKSLFKELEEKEERKVDKPSVAGRTGASSLQDWSQTPKVIKNSVERRSWQQGSGLMPVFEEDEEGGDLPGEEEGKPADEAHAEENLHNQSQQMSTMSAEIHNLKAKHENLLPDTLTGKQPIQDCPPTDQSHCSDEIDLQQKRHAFLYPDGTFLAELVDICSPDEDEEEGVHKNDV